MHSHTDAVVLAGTGGVFLNPGLHTCGPCSKDAPFAPFLRNAESTAEVLCTTPCVRPRSHTCFGAFANREQGLHAMLCPLMHMPFYTCLAGALPSALATNPHLGKLDVAYNRLSSLPPEWVGGWGAVASSSLVTLRISSNNLSGPFPAGLAPASHLVALVADSNAFRCRLAISPS